MKLKSNSNPMKTLNSTLTFWHESNEFETSKSQFDYAMELGKLLLNTTYLEISNLYETLDNL